MSLNQIQDINKESYAYYVVSTVLTKLGNLINPGTGAMLGSIDFLEYIMLHDRFAKHGIFITDRNIEETYIKILEEDDDGLNDCLERYLTLIERVQPIIKLRQKFDEFIDRIVELDDSDSEEIKQLASEYFGDYIQDFKK